MTPKFLLLLAVLIGLVAAQICSNGATLPIRPDDFLQTGSLALMNVKRLGLRDHRYPVTLAYPVPAFGFVATASLSDYQYAGFPQWLDLSIQAIGNKGSFFQILMQITEDLSWNTIRCNYLASSRNDFYAGSFQVDPSLPLANGLLIVTQAIPGLANGGSGFNILVFLAGIKSSSAGQLSLSVLTSTVSTSKGMLTVTLQPSLGSFESLLLSYVLQAKSDNVVFYEESTTPTAPPTYPYSGAVGIQLGQVSKLNKGFSVRPTNVPSSAEPSVVCSGSRCPSSCVTPTACTGSSGILIGSGPTCLLCGANQIISNFQCQATSSPSTPSTPTPTPLSTITPCPFNMIVSPLTGRCVCVSGFVYSSGGCQPCKNLKEDGSCADCLDGFMPISGVCVPCPKGSVWNPASRWCDCKPPTVMSSGGECGVCPANSVWNGEYCTCIQGYFILLNQCVSCPPNSGWNGTVCACFSDYVLIGQNCERCPADRFWNGSACVCSSPQFESSGQCRNCTAPGRWNGTACECAGGQLYYNDACQICPPFSSYNGSVCNCYPNFNYVRGACVQCEANADYDPVRYICVCKPGYFASYQLCVACHPSCYTCVASALNACLSCRAGKTLVNGRCLP